MLNRGPKMSLIKIFLGFTTEAKPDLNFMLPTQTKTRSRQSQHQCSTMNLHMDWTTLDSRAENANLSTQHVLKWFSNTLLDAFMLNYINTLMSTYYVQHYIQNLLIIHYVLQINPMIIKYPVHTKEQSASVALAGLESRAICQRKTLIPCPAVIALTGYLEYYIPRDVAST